MRMRAERGDGGSRTLDSDSPAIADGRGWRFVLHHDRHRRPVFPRSFGLPRYFGVVLPDGFSTGAGGVTGAGVTGAAFTGAAGGGASRPPTTEPGPR